MNPNRSLNKLLAFLIMLICVDTYAVDDITLKSLDDSEHQLSEYIGHGKWLILNIWGARCPPCVEEVPELVRFHDEHKDTDAIVVGIAIDFPSYGYAKKQEVIDFSDAYFIDFPVLLSDSHITEKVGLGRLEGLPTTYLFNPEGIVVGMQVGGITQKIIEQFIKKLKLQSSGSLKEQ